MEVKIITQYGENVFDLDEKTVLEIVHHAFEFAAKSALEKNENPAQKAAEDYEDYAPEPKRSRTNSLFGSGWRESVAKATDKNNEPEVAEPYYEKTQEEGYKGFLLIKCEKCGKIKGFCSKHSLRYYECECGHRTELGDMRPLHLHCKCGSYYKYQTNVQDAEFSYHCLNCGSPVDLELNGRRNAYVTIGGGTGRIGNRRNNNIARKYGMSVYNGPFY